jgi:hypothetical protein
MKHGVVLDPTGSGGTIPPVVTGPSDNLGPRGSRRPAPYPQVESKKALFVFAIFATGTV